MNSTSALLLAFAEQNPNIIFCFDVESNSFTYTNSAFKSTFQKDGKEPLISKIFDMVKPDDKNFLKDVYSKLREGIFRDNVEFKMQIDSPKERVFKMGILKEATANGKGIITASLEDITAFRNNEDILNELTERKNAILNIMSHDLAGPLNSIKTFTYLLTTKLPKELDQQLLSMLTSIERLSENCIQMLQEFIQLEFIKSVNADLLKERKDLITTLNNIKQQYLSAQNNLQVSFEFNTDKPKIFVDIDENKFMQVVNNLISNSLKFTPDGGKITIGVEEHKDAVIVFVADNGVGIPIEHHANLFEKFTTARRVGLKGEPSVGLGMSIIKTIVEWHKGKIWFESEVDEGTTVFIELKKSI